MTLLNAFAGLLVGIVVGMTGVGGGALMSPILILLFGVAPATAIGTDLWFAAITKSAGAVIHHRQRSADYRIVKLLAIGSVPAAAGAGAVLYYLGVERMTDATLPRILGVVLILTAIATFFRPWLAQMTLKARVRAHPRFVTIKGVATIACGVVLGAMVTLTSVGAGALGATMLMALYPRRLTIKTMVGTDITHAIPIAIVGGIIHYLIGDVDWALLAMLVLGSIPGIVIGSKIGGYVSERKIVPLLALVLLISGVKLLV